MLKHRDIKENVRITYLTQENSSMNIQNYFKYLIANNSISFA